MKAMEIHILNSFHVINTLKKMKIYMRGIANLKNSRYLWKIYLILGLNYEYSKTDRVVEENLHS